MKRLLLDSLTLSQFKGAKSVNIEPRGDNFNVYGDNASGKTTIADAFVWLLFAKNLEGSAKFEIKTLDIGGKPVHHLNHSVSAEFRLPDDSISLSKSYKEKWVKQRGKPNQEFEGHTTDHTINKVPVQEKEYAARVASICDEGLFRILSDPMRFNEGLTWQERRKALMRFAGNITDDAVTQAHPALAEVTAILGSHTPEDLRKMLMAMRPSIAKEIDTIPVRIDELQRAIDAPTGSSMPNMEHYRSQLIQLQNDRATITSGGQMAELRKQKAELEAAEILRIGEERKAAHQVHDQAITATRALAAKAQEAKDRLAAAEREAKALESEIHRMGEDLEVKRAAYRELSAESWDTEAEGVCRSCGQTLPADRLDALRDAYNLRKAMRLEANREEGKALNSQREAKKSSLEALTSTISNMSEAASAADKEWQAAIAHAESLTTPEPDTEAAAAHRQAIAVIDGQVSELMGSNANQLNAVDTEIVDVQMKIQAAEAVIAKAEAAKSAEARITELGNDEQRLAGEIEEIDRKLYLLDEWVRAKVSMLEESINARFEIVQFKLFMAQVNGAIAEVCETTVNGVPWGNLNHGARINGGLDIINTLARHYEFAPPIFIDNAESVTSIIPTIGQQIRLIVSAADKELRFESATKPSNTKELQPA